jgi:hypothetical protein
VRNAISHFSQIEMSVIIARSVSVVFAQFQPCIACKIKQVSDEEFNCTLCDPWIKPLLRHKFISFEDFRSKNGFFPCLFRKKKPQCKFVLNSKDGGLL